MSDTKKIIFALCAVMMVNAVFAAASDPSGLTLVDLTSPSPEGDVTKVTSSRAFDGANDTPPSSAFNDTEGNRFLINGIGGDSGPVDLIYSFDTPVKITSYSIKNYHEQKVDLRAPNSWTFYGSNDEGATWELLDTQTDEINWTANEFRFYYFGDKGAFTRYKIEFTVNNGNEYLQFARLEFYDVKLEDAVPIEFGEVQSSSDYTSWSVVQRYNLREEAAPLENSDVVILIGDSPETLAESNIVPTIDENGISFGMTDCPNGKTYYWQVKCRVTYMGVSKEWGSEGEIKTKILATFIPGKTNFLNSESWDIGAVPNDNYTDIHIDGDDEKNTVAKLESSETVYVTNGVLRVDVGDSLELHVTGKSQQRNINMRVSTFENFGIIKLMNSSRNNQNINFSTVESPFLNAQNASVIIENTNASITHSVDFLLNNSTNNGVIFFNNKRKSNNSTKTFLTFRGIGTLINNGIISGWYASGGGSVNNTRLELNYSDAIGDVKLTGIGMIRFNKDLQDPNGQANITMNGTASTSKFQTRLINDTDHSILGNGAIEKCNIYNKGLIGSLGTNDYLNIACEYYGGNLSIMTNDVTGRIVAGFGKGIRFKVKYQGSNNGSAKTYENPGYNSRFTNLGLIESRTGSEIFFDKGVNSSSVDTRKANISVKSNPLEEINPLELWGTVAGGGLFRTERTMCIGDGAILSPGDLANTNGTGVSTCGTLTFSSNLVMRAGSVSEFQFKRADSFDSLHVGGTLKVDGTLKVVGRPHGGTYRMITSDCPIISDNEKFFSAFDMSQADGVRSPRLTSGSEEYDVEVTSTATDPESGEEITVTETVKRTRYYIDASFPGGFSIVIR